MPEIESTSSKDEGYFKTDIKGFDELFEKGIPKGSAVLIAGGAGSGKTILSLQVFTNAIARGDKCFYMSLEESEKRLLEHIENFGWASKMSSGDFIIKRFNSFDISRSVDALLAKAKGELLIDVEPVILPKDFKPDVVIVDSISAISSAFVGKEGNYRSYIEQLFRFFEELGATTFLITETEDMPKRFSRSGVEEFLADGVIVLYNVRRGELRESALEILKMRGVKHGKKIVAMNINNEGISIYPEQQVWWVEKH